VFFANGSPLDWRDLRHRSLKSVLRMSLVQAVAAMDCYFHDHIEWHFGKILSKCPEDAHDALKRFSIPVEAVKRVIDEYNNTTVGIRRAFEKELRKQSIQSVRSIEDSLKIIGVTCFWGNAATSMDVDASSLKQWLGAIARRRNQIVHEGDRIRLQNGRLSQDRDIARDDIFDDLHVIDCFVHAMEDQIELKATA